MELLMHAPSEDEVIILGSGTCTPSLTRQPSGTLLRFAGQQLLLDSGSGTIGRLMAQGTPVHDLDALLYTHLHLDHTGDLFPLLFSLRNSYGLRRRRALPIFGPPGFKTFFQHLLVLYGRWVETDQYRLDVQELAVGDGLTLPGGTRLQTCAVQHTSSSLGYRFELNGGKTIAFSGDTADTDALLGLLHQADLAVVECSSTDTAPIPGHMTPTPLARLASKAGVKTLVISHFYPPAESPVIEETLHAIFEGRIIRAQDGMHILLSTL
jgi:ribonuclease BN (tRNA processing enzyme)